MCRRFIIEIYDPGGSFAASNVFSKWQQRLQLFVCDVSWHIVPIRNVSVRSLLAPSLPPLFHLARRQGYFPFDKSF